MNIGEKFLNWICPIKEVVPPEAETGWVIRGEKGTSLRLDKDDMRALIDLIIKQKNLNLLSGRRPR